jgi:hypothetical protein
MNSAQTKYTKPGKDPAMKTSHAAMFASLLAATIFAVGCGSKSAPVPPPPTGGTEGLAVFMKDAPADSVLSLQVTIASISAVNSSGESVTLTNTPRTYELKHLSLAPTLVTFQNIKAGSYTAIAFALTNPQMQILDANGNLVTLNGGTTPSITLAHSSVSVPVTISLAKNANGGVNLDFNLAKSLSVDGLGNYNLTPTLTGALTAATDPVPQLIGCVGTVSALAKDGSGFDLQLAESAVIVHVVADANTFFDPAVQKLANVTVGQILELSASLKADGNYLAKAINSSAASLPTRQQGVFTGTYTNVTGQTVISIAAQN